MDKNCAREAQTAAFTEIRGALPELESRKAVLTLEFGPVVSLERSTPRRRSLALARTSNNKNRRASLSLSLSLSVSPTLLLLFVSRANFDLESVIGDR